VAGDPAGVPVPVTRGVCLENVAATAAAYGDERPSGGDDWHIPEASEILKCFASIE
jgi:hypothetical protein